MDAILDHESTIRLSVFGILFVVMALLETFKPRRKRNHKRVERWFSNLGILVLGAIFARILLPWVPVSVAIYAQANGIGLLQAINVPDLPFILIGVLLLDFMIYVQHVLMHKVPILWRLHRLHHADLDYDVTTGIRFHPIEIILSLLYKMGLILVLGVDPISVVLFEVILNGMAMFNHANFRLPLGLDRILRLVFVTPDMHRVHHSSIQRETDSNYGFNISLWDRICRTYVAQPEKGHDDMTIGLDYFRDNSQLRLDQMLLQPFKRADK
ncbi:sterol desaturase family protein [Terasakiella sp. A23]|uniref:sterol desaturase family protein n=1 Tax=Terasakiella sp. FCG-A23 TaxID=3080561 RepID=UPI0029556E89|nr:sterol desaturase family protein [Terasakiella sp. A23]MDV7338736.1 sterol desaturase family protein [Terasakiella sp. A23]